MVWGCVAVLNDPREGRVPARDVTNNNNNNNNRELFPLETTTTNNTPRGSGSGHKRAKERGEGKTPVERILRRISVGLKPPPPPVELLAAIAFSGSLCGP